jgi:hypothetical protein
MILALLLAAATPPAEAEELGLRLARVGTLASLLPIIAAKETEELVADHPDYSDADKATLRKVAGETYATHMESVLKAEGHAFATRLSVSDLKILVAFQESDVAKRFRALQPQIIGETMASIGRIDAKKDAMAAFCKQTGKGCEAK